MSWALPRLQAASRLAERTRIASLASELGAANSVNPKTDHTALNDISPRNTNSNQDMIVNSRGFPHASTPAGRLNGATVIATALLQIVARRAALR